LADANTKIAVTPLIEAQAGRFMDAPLIDAASQSDATDCRGKSNRCRAAFSSVCVL
jgi:hypothetical protein